MKPPLLFAGPCVLESRDHTLKMAEEIRKRVEKTPFTYVFKASFDKANRTSISSYRGPGLTEGLAIFAEVKEKVGVPVITDIHLPEQADPVAEVVDILQIPAFLCRQTDLIVAAARTGKPVNIKKGQFLAPNAMEHAVKKARESGGKTVYLTERGTFMGYGDLVVDFRSLLTMRSFADGVIYDATHSVQQPGGEGSRSGGKREFIIPLARAAAAVGVDGFFLEVHDDPDNALSDAASQLPLADLTTFLQEVLNVMKGVES